MNQTKSHMFFWGGVLLIIALVAVLASNYHLALAAEQKQIVLQDQSIQPDVTAFIRTRDSAATEASALNSQQDLTITAPSLPVTEQDILREILRYKEQASVYAMQPGWTLVKFDQYDIISMNNPKPLPPKYQKEFWSHFNQDKKVFEQVDYVISPETGKTPLGVFKDGELVSLWNGNEKVQKEAYTPSYDLYLTSSIQGLIEANIPHQLSFKQDGLSGKLISVIDLRTQYTEEDKKWLNIKFEKAIWGQEERFYFDPQTGMLLKYEHFYVLEDMSLMPSAITDNFEYIPNSEPPSDILDLLANGGK